VETRRMGEHPDCERKDWEKDRARCGGHPCLADTAGVHQPAADVAGDAAGNDERSTETGKDDVGAAATFEVGDDQTPDHPERQAAEEDRDSLPGIGKQGEEHQGGHRSDGKGDEQQAAAGAPGLRADLDADEFRDRAAEDLAEDERGLEGDPGGEE
jgi:hypothetical protein